MQEEFDALLMNRTWDLVPRPSHCNIVSGKWVFKHKLHPDGSLERYKAKARWVVRGFTQRAGVDFGETFTPVVKPATIRTVLALVALKPGRLDSSTCPMHFFMATCRNMSSASSPSGLPMPTSLTPCAC